MLERILGRPLRLQALAIGVAAAGPEVANCDAQPTALPAVGTLLGVQADGPGGPMGQPPTPRLPRRLGKGHKRTTKQAAVGTGLSTMAPSPRPPQEVVAALLQDPDGRAPGARPVPVGKDRRATRAGQAIARARLVERTAPRDGPHIQARVALTEGAEALQQQWLAGFPEPTFGLAILHATESRWDAANALLGDPHPHRTAWVRSDLEPLVAGQTEAVLTALEADARAPTGTATPRQAVRRTVGSDRRHRPSRHDDESRAQGGPIGPGVIEGACRHLVNDRLEPSGMRWTTAGAQAVLDLRAVRLNGPWEAYGPFHRHQPHRRW